MNYKDKYENLINQLKKAKEEHGGYTFSSVVDKIVPELHESEDERIRKGLIKGLSAMRDIHKHQTFSDDAISINDAIAWLEKQGEQKSDNKVEPKFKVGDWILIDRPCRIELIDDNGDYVIQYYDSGTKSVFSKKFCETRFHLWTIQDINDGDVLVVGDEDGTGIAICGKNDELGNSILYGYYDDENGFVINTPIALVCLLHPATKKESDLLFQKMKESGYEWDTKKKELKKIEQSCYHNDGLYYAIDILEKTIGKVEGYQSDDGKMEHQIAIETVNALYNKKPSWNEEDEANMDAVWKACGQVYGVKYQGILGDWLKSLKDRVQPQPKQEWSKEDEKILKELVEEVKDQLDSVPSPDCMDKEDEKVLKQLNKWMNWLKSLKSQKHWKPSEEQMETLKFAANDYVMGETKKNLESLYNDLLKL